MKHISVLGGGPAGSAAAIAALQQGASVRLFEPSRFPRHKVCGEFLSPGVPALLERLGVWPDFLLCRPAVLGRLILRIGPVEKRFRLPEPAHSLSRYRLDHLLLDKARSLGAVLQRERPSQANPPLVLATGREARAPRGRRLFAFKAHFHGPVGDAVELFFFPGGYAGVSAVEDGLTNVCGLAPEPLLAAHGFDIDRFVAAQDALSRRLRPLYRTMNWLMTGPLRFLHRFHEPGPPGVYRAGDALSFVDPFTGSGLLSALLTGRLAGIAAARGTPVPDYLAQCRARLERPFRVASLLRSLLETAGVKSLAHLAPPGWLFRLTRPQLRASENVLSG